MSALAPLLLQRWCRRHRACHVGLLAVLLLRLLLWHVVRARLRVLLRVPLLPLRLPPRVRLPLRLMPVPLHVLPVCMRLPVRMLPWH